MVYLVRRNPGSVYKYYFLMIIRSHTIVEHEYFDSADRITMGDEEDFFLFQGMSGNRYFSRILVLAFPPVLRLFDPPPSSS